MKKSYAYLIIFTITLFFNACKDRRCDEVVCENNGWCKEGFCVCVNFYEGDSCSVEGRLKFFGTYTGKFSDFYGDVRDTSFSLQTDDVSPLILNMNNGSIKLVLNGAITADLPSQQLQLQDTLVNVVGNAAILGDSLTVNLNYIKDFERISAQFRGIRKLD
jgi:hypothetical protein